MNPPHTPRHLYVTDLDGTLLSTDSRVTPWSASVISRLSRAGILISVATARTPATVEPLLAHTYTTPPAIVMTGAAMWDRQNHRYIHPRFIPADIARHATALCHSHGLRPMTYTIPPGSEKILMYFHGTPDRREEKFIAERSHLTLKHISILPNTPAPPSYPSTILLFALGPTEKVITVAQYLRSQCGCAVSAYPDIFNPEVGLLEIFAPGVSKAQAVTRLREITHATHLTVFGDNLNDIPMFQVADTSVAVANAQPQVLAQASLTIGPNATDAVARYILDANLAHFPENI